jgi:hypothetical protein
MQNNPKCRSRYGALGHVAILVAGALRGVAARLLEVIYVLLRRQMLFDSLHGTPAPS